MAPILSLPQELWGMIFYYLLEYTMDKADITRESCRDLQNLRLSHRSFANEHAINHLLFRSVLLRISKHSCERLEATHQRIGQYVQRLIIEPSQFMVIRDFHEYRVLLTAHHDASRRYDRDALSIPRSWDDIETTEHELLDGYQAYKQRQEEDKLAVKLLRDHAQRIYSSFTNLESIDVVKSWDDGGPAAQRIFTLMPLGFAGFLQRESITGRIVYEATSRVASGRIGLVYGGLLDEAMFRYSCLNIIRTTWTVLPYLLQFMSREIQVNLGSNISFRTRSRPLVLPVDRLYETRLREAYSQIEDKSISKPVYGPAGSDTEDADRFKYVIDQNLHRSGLAFIAHICNLIAPVSLRIQRAEWAWSAPRRLAGQKHLNVFASLLEELTIEDKIVRTDLLFRVLNQTSPCRLSKIVFRNCVLLYGTVRNEQAFLKLMKEASNLKTAAGNTEMVIESKSDRGFRRMYSTRDKYVHDRSLYRDLVGWRIWPRRRYLDDDESEISP